MAAPPFLWAPRPCLPSRASLSNLEAARSLLCAKPCSTRQPESPRAPRHSLSPCWYFLSWSLLARHGNVYRLVCVSLSGRSPTGDGPRGRELWFTSVSLRLGELVHGCGCSFHTSPPAPLARLPGAPASPCWGEKVLLCLRAPLTGHLLSPQEPSLGSSLCGPPTAVGSLLGCRSRSVSPEPRSTNSPGGTGLGHN